MVIGHGAFPVGARSELRGAMWGSLFVQRIRQFGSMAYEAVREVQDDRDRTAGARLTWRQPAGPGTLRLALNALASRHRQQNTALDEMGTFIERVEPLSFQQQIYSGGMEYEVPVTARLHTLLGGSLDAALMPETGDKPRRDPFVAGSVTAGLVYDVGASWTLRAATGRKVRFPTMRELFGEALGRFLVNPDLRPETALLADIGASVRRGRLAGAITASSTGRPRPSTSARWRQRAVQSGNASTWRGAGLLASRRPGGCGCVDGGRSMDTSPGCTRGHLSREARAL